MPDTLRGSILSEAKTLTEGDRNAAYGDPYDNLGDITVLWTAYLHAKYAGRTIGEVDFALTAEDQAWLVVLQKMARTFRGRYHADNYIDGAAYSAIAGECRQRQEEN